MAKGRKSRARRAKAAGTYVPPAADAADAADDATDALPVKAAKAAKPVKASAPAPMNAFARLGRYFTDVRAEMTRVVWPTRPEVVSASGIVITTLIIFIVLILVFDQMSLQVVHVIGRIGGS